MHRLQKYFPAVVAALLAVVALVVIYPYYQYYVDPDAVAYLTISKKYAADEYARAVNGYWGPWSCWVTALFIKQGLGTMVSVVIANMAGCLGFLFITNSLLLYFNVNKMLLWLLNIALVIFIPCMVFWQLFDDIWQAFFLLCVLRIMIKDGYKTKPVLWVATGILAAFAYFAKAYAFMFFGLNVVCVSFLITKAWEKENRLQWLKICGVSIVVMVICAFPWLYQLHLKYGGWTTSNALKLNVSWALVGHPEWKDGIKYLIPPAYPDATSYWEDPWLANGKLSFFWDSLALFKMQIARTVYILFMLMTSMNELTCFAFAIWLVTLAVVCSKKVRSYFPEKMNIVALSFLLFPVGMLLKSAESRYIWYMLPLSMVIGGVALQRVFTFVDKKWLNAIMAIVFSISYVWFSLFCYKSMFNEGKKEHQIAATFNQLGIHGTIASNAEAGLPMQRYGRIAYFSGLSVYSLPSTAISHNDLLAEMRRYKVNYYLYFCSQMDQTEYSFKDENGIAFPEVTGDRIEGVRVFRVN